MAYIDIKGKYIVYYEQDIDIILISCTHCIMCPICSIKIKDTTNKYPGVIHILILQ